MSKKKDSSLFFGSEKQFKGLSSASAAKKNPSLSNSASKANTSAVKSAKETVFDVEAGTGIAGKKAADRGIEWGKSGNVSQGREEVVERAKNEREERILLRDITKHALRIQRWWRGTWIQYNTIIQFRELFDRKMKDIENLSKLLYSTKNIVLAPPPKICIELCRYLLFGRRLMSDMQRMMNYCEYVLNTSLTQFEMEKNVILMISSPENMLLLKKLFASLVFTIDMLASQVKLDPTASRVIIEAVKSLVSLAGLNGPQKVCYIPELEACFVNIRAWICDNDIKSIFPGSSLYHIAALCFTKCSSRLTELFEDCDANNMTARKAFDSFLINKIFQFCYKISLCDKEFVENRLKIFFQEMLSVPMLTTYLDNESILLLTSVSSVQIYLDSINYSKLMCLRSLLISGFTSNQWLLGNLCHIFSQLDFKCDSSQDYCLSDGALILFAESILFLLEKNSFPGLFFGSKGVTWEKKGVVLTAVGIPYSLRFQILSLLNLSLLRGLHNRLFSNYDEVDLESFNVDQSDLFDMNEAMQSDAAKMARDNLEAEIESSTWFTSKWASKMMNNVVKSFGFTGSQKKFVFTNSMKQNVKSQMNVSLLNRICTLWSHIIPQAVAAPIDSEPWKNVCSFAFSGTIVRDLWIASLIVDCKKLSSSFSFVKDVPTEESCMIPLDRTFVPILITLAAVLKVVSIATDDSELYQEGKPIPLIQMISVIRCFKLVIFNCIKANPDLIYNELNHCFNDGSSTSLDDPMVKKETNYQTNRNAYIGLMVKSMISVLSDLYARWARRPFCKSESVWEISAITPAVLRHKDSFSSVITKYMPWSISFYERMKLFRETIESERIQLQGLDDTNFGQRSRGHAIRIRRQHILEDGIRSLDNVINIKDRISVRYVNDFGEEESGIDLGGLFKDFWTDLSSRVFDSSYGLFATTTSNLLFPSPVSAALYDLYELENIFEFLGKVLGKALFENITVQPQFAHFFLSFMSGRYNYTGILNDLITLDAELYKNLVFLKYYDGDITELCLTFSIVDTSFGQSKEIELIPGGSNLSVTASNKHRYINLVAKYYLKDRINVQSKAFFRGLYSVVTPELLCMFCAPQLQLLISGLVTGISVLDLQNHCRYAAGYSGGHKVIRWFWEVVEEMSPADRALVVKFVTSCERPPSLGFSSLNPPFTIQRLEDNDDRLPSASTCFNTLKLPSYSSKRILKDKLTFAIRSNAGFDLT